MCICILSRLIGAKTFNMNFKKSLLPVLLFVSLQAIIHAQVSCPDGAAITANDKCVFLSWVTPPMPLPSNTEANGDTYSFESGTGTASDPAVYRNAAPGGGACNANQSILFNGDLSFNGGEPCTFIEGLLGVEWLSLDVRAEKNTILITWVVISDEYNDFFEVERSKDGIHWSSITVIDNKSFQQVETYSYTDRGATQGSNYYRISQTDLSGLKSFSNIRAIEYHQTTAIEVFQTNGSIFVRGLSDVVADQGRIVLSNITGQVQNQWLIEENKNNYSLDDLNLIPGLYIVTIAIQQILHSEKILIH